MQSDHFDPPVPPVIEQSLVVALVEHARAQSEFEQQDIDDGLLHGHAPHPQAVKNVDGWAFVALALAETYDLDEFLE